MNVYDEISTLAKDKLAELQIEKLDIEKRLRRIEVELAGYTRIRSEASGLHSTSDQHALGPLESAQRIPAASSPFESGTVLLEKDIPPHLHGRTA